MSNQVCCFTGHRPQHFAFGYRESDPCCVALKARLRREIEALINGSGVNHFISGMALGVDTYAAEILVDLKKTYPHITWEAAIPCENQAGKWRASDRERYRNLVRQADKTTVVSRDYTPDCMHRRNRYMVDASDVVIAVWDGSLSGTGKTVAYARATGKTLVIISPQEFE